MSEGLRSWVEGRAGRILLDRPEALNAVTHEMVLGIEAALLAWASDERVRLVIVEGAGDRAFSAGGDIQALYYAGRAGDFGFGQRFWRDEYRLNRLISRYPKPYVALMDGIVMGGGAGVSVHGSHRLVTERAVVAMPECAIGLVPDVGVSKLLAEAPGRLGEYLALTGARMGPGEAIEAGFADAFVAQAGLAALIAELTGTGDADAIVKTSKALPASRLTAEAGAIEKLFGGSDALAIVEGLEREAETLPLAAEAATAMRRASPLSLQATLEIVRAVRGTPTIEAALAAEYRFTFRAQAEGDFLEGIRAAMIDRDRAPLWTPPRLEDLSPSKVSTMLAPLGADELNFAPLDFGPLQTPPKGDFA